MMEYLLGDEVKTRDSLEHTFASSFAGVDNCLRLGVLLLDRTSDFVTTEKRSAHSGLVVMGLYMKALKTVRAIRLAASRDLQEDAAVLCRTLLETMIAILYILQRKTPRRAVEYLAAMLMRKKRTMEEW